MISLFLSLFISFPAHATNVDLRPNQTPIKNQGSRATCITFASTAALEAAYKRAGFGELDLSEQFVNQLGKTFWLHPFWNEILAKGHDGAEGQIGAYAGGNGVEYLEMFANGFRIPREGNMPYHNTDYTAADYPPLARDLSDPYWLRQRNMSGFNLDPRFLPRSALEATQYFSARKIVKIGATSRLAIDMALDAGHEVVWDTNLANTDSPIWQPCRPSQPNCPGAAHSMLIVGYDHSAPLAKDHYLIVKNSWGPTTTPGANGFTYISYDYLQYGISAGYIESVNPPGPWQEIAFVGRWNISLDGIHGMLDIYHMPGIMKDIWARYGTTTADHRLGTLYVANGAFKVNGVFRSDEVEFWVDLDQPNVPWDVLNHGYHYFLKYENGGAAGKFLAGSIVDPAGKVFGAVAKQQSYMEHGIAIAKPYRAASYLGSWALYFGPALYTLELTRVDDSWMTPAQKTKFEGVVGTIRQNGPNPIFNIKVLVSKANPNELTIISPDYFGNFQWGGSAGAHVLNFEDGIAAGKTYPTNGNQQALVMMKVR